MYVDGTATDWSSSADLVAHAHFPHNAELSLAVEASDSSHVPGQRPR